MRFSWKSSWGVNRVTDLDDPFVEDQRGYLLHRNGEVLEAYTVPQKSARKAAEAAIEVGGVAFKRWPMLWGICVGLSIPETLTAWVVSHEYALGKFGSIGVKFIEGIPFSDRVTVFEERYTQAAQYAFAYGVRRKSEELIRSVLDKPFILNPWIYKLWGPEVGNHKGKSVIEALRALQGGPEVALETIFKNSKTTKEMYEQYKQATN